MTDANRRRALEFEPVGNEDDLPGIAHDRLADAHFAIIEVEQRALLVDGRRADDGMVDLELADEVDCPLCLIDGTPSRDDVALAARVLARYSQGRSADQVTVCVQHPGGVDEQMTIAPLAPADLPEEWHV
jgi:hypothetical protein